MTRLQPDTQVAVDDGANDGESDGDNDEDDDGDNDGESTDADKWCSDMGQTPLWWSDDDDCDDFPHKRLSNLDLTSLWLP